jgi:uncharacterized protein
MKNIPATICLTIALLLGSVGVSWSADFQKGMDAFDSGDYATALRVWRPLAKQGNHIFQGMMGSMYKKGKGVPQDYKTAVKWYKLAAEQGHALSQSHLGEMYKDGKGVPQDYKTAVKWYRLAAEQGHALSQAALGAMYVMGRGVIQDHVYAHMWANLSASNRPEIGRKLRDIIAKRMTPADISKAQSLARECVRKKFKGC